MVLPVVLPVVEVFVEPPGEVAEFPAEPEGTTVLVPGSTELEAGFYPGTDGSDLALSLASYSSLAFAAAAAYLATKALVAY